METIKEDETILKSSHLYKNAFTKYRYVLRLLKYGSEPFEACRENMHLVNGVWEPSCKYWTSYSDNLKTAEKEYLKRIETEGKH